MGKTIGLWLLWLALAFGALNLYGPDLSAYRRAGDPPDISASDLIARLSKPELILFHLRDDADTQRYFAYANAILGRPYAAYFVRTLDEWREDAAQTATNRPGVVTPQRPLLPWRDFSVEYPPGMLLFALMPALFVQDFNTYHFLFSLEMEALLTAAVVLAAKTARIFRKSEGDAVLGWAVGSLAALGVAAVRRYDPCVSLAIAATVYGVAARRPALAGGAMSLGAVCKGVPILLAPLGLFWHVLRGERRELAIAIATSLACLAAAGAFYACLAGPHVFDALAYHGQRPLQFESLYGGLLIAARLFDPTIATSVYSFGSDNIVSIHEPALRRLAEILPWLAQAAIFGWAFARMRKAEDDEQKFAVLLNAACACFVSYATLGKVFSPQYLVWLIPLGALAAAKARPLAGKLMISGFLVAQLEYPFLYSGLSDSLDPVFGVVVVIRALLLWAWIAVLLTSPGKTRLAAIDQGNPA